MTYDTILIELSKKGCRITPQRKIFLNILLDNQSTLLSAEELLKLSQQDSPDINATTVYRNLDLLNSLGLLFSTHIDKSTTAYKLICSNHHHHHLICIRCGKLEAIDFCPISLELSTMIKNKSFTLTDHNLELYGICKDCVM